ncbi:MAG: hypothetical protein ACLQQ4_10945 [Bacteroidia bacterium]
MKIKFIWTVALMLFMVSCNSERMKFDKTGWMEDDGTHTYPYRNAMLDDLLKHHKLKGLKNSQLIDLIGSPENNYARNGDTIFIYYNIVMKYDGTDPYYSKKLSIKLSKDSIVQSYKVTEWNKVEGQ